jgi:ribose transport system ATP-binding protein
MYIGEAMTSDTLRGRLDAEPLLRFERVRKRFGATLAVDDVSFDVAAGEICALLGENGAGKSTLIKCLAGVNTIDRGTMSFEGHSIEGLHGRDGIAFIHQDLGLIEWMTVSENMAVSYGFPRRRGLIDWKATNDRAASALDRVGGGIDPRRRVFDLTRTEKSLLAIARALTTEARLLVLDEPTASLPQAEVERLFTVLRDLQLKSVGMIYVSHRLDEVFQIADSVAVMRNGALVGRRHVVDIDESELVRLIVGHDPDPVEIDAPADSSSKQLELRNLQVGDVGPISFCVAAGEVVGLIGLRGAGQEVVGRAICGVEHATGGTLLISGKAVSVKNTRESVALGLAFVTSNREAEGLATGLPVRENVYVNPRVWGRNNWSFRARNGERKEAMNVISRHDVRPLDTERPADTLSGGNQQKVILARWLGVKRSVLVLEEPTMGVDVGAKADIYRLLRQSLQTGTAVIVVSTDYEEIVKICHRALVFRGGRVVAELPRSELRVGTLIAAASGSGTAKLDQRSAS